MPIVLSGLPSGILSQACSRRRPIWFARGHGKYRRSGSAHRLRLHNMTWSPSKSIGLCPQGLESPRCRFLFGVENASLPIVTSRAQAHLGRRGLMRAHPKPADVEPRAAASPPDLKASMPGRPARELDWPMSMLRKGPGRGKNPSYKDTLAERLGRRPAKPMGSPRVGSNPTMSFSVIADSSACTASMYVLLFCPDAEHCFPVPRKKQCFLACNMLPRLPQAIPRDTQGCQRDMAQRARSDGLAPQPANCKCAGHILSSELLTDLPSRTLGITLHQPV
jgi:hypothetical protein